MTIEVAIMGESSTGAALGPAADAGCLAHIGTNHIERFQRVPSDLRRYLEYTAQIKKKYGSVMDFIVKKRLHWGEGRPQDLKPKGRPFECDGETVTLFVHRSFRLSS